MSAAPQWCICWLINAPVDTSSGLWCWLAYACAIDVYCSFLLQWIQQYLLSPRPRISELSSTSSVVIFAQVHVTSMVFLNMKGPSGLIAFNSVFWGSIILTTKSVWKWAFHYISRQQLMRNCIKSCLFCSRRKEYQNWSSSSWKTRKGKKTKKGKGKPLRR